MQSVKFSGGVFLDDGLFDGKHLFILKACSLYKILRLEFIYLAFVLYLVLLINIHQ